VRTKDEIGELAKSFNDMTADLKTHIDNMKNINLFSQSIVQTAELDRLLKIILDKTLEIIGASGGKIFAYDEKDSSFKVSKKSEGILFSKDCGFISHIFREADVIELNDDFLKNINMTAKEREYISSNSLKIAVPMIIKNKMSGLIFLKDKINEIPYHKEEKELLMTLANNATFALENAYLTEKQLERELLGYELQLARDIQYSMLPEKSPVINNYELGHISIPANEIGGDYYDFIPIDDNHMGISIADVSGKGIPAALYMMITRNLLRSSAIDNLNAHDVLAKVNELLYDDMQGKNMFVSMFYSILNIKEGILEYSNAGQTYPIYYNDRERGCSYLEIKKFPLGICKNNDYEKGELKLVNNDMLLFYTDGVVEAMNKENELFGFNRLMDIAKTSASNSADDIVHNILHEVNNFSEGTVQNDDLTIVTVKSVS
jgi:sigma-B regulation protein RsbU (phosphoserine phosphatase)